MNETAELFAVMLLRASQAAALSLPTLLCGLLVAGVLRAAIGQANTRHWLSSGSFGDLLRAWLLAFFMPVCSIGVLPVLFVLRAMGVRLGVLVVIAISAPLVTPWSLGYMMDRAGLAPSALLVVATALMALAAGFITDRFTPSTPHNPDKPYPDSLPFDSVLLNTLWASGKSLTPGVLMLMLAGVFGAGVIAAFIPANGMGEWLVERNIPHALLLLGVPSLTYVTPEIAALQAGEIVHASTMPGLLIGIIGLGAAVHLGTLLLAVRSLPIKTFAAVLGVVLVVLAASSTLTDLLLHDPTYAPEDSHAFEDHGRPFHLLDHPQGPMAGFWHRFTRPVGIHSLAAGVGIGLLILLSLKKAKPKPSILTSPAEPKVASKTLVLTGFAPFAFLSLLIAGYTFVPPPTMLAKELEAASADVLVLYRRGDVDAARPALKLIERRVNMVQLSRLLWGRLTPSDMPMRITAARQTIAQLKAATEAGPAHNQQAQNQQTQNQQTQTDLTLELAKHLTGISRELKSGGK